MDSRPPGEGGAAGKPSISTTPRQTQAVTVGPPETHQPIDRGWAWMICLGAFGSNFFMHGFLRCSGILMTDSIRTYQSNPTAASFTVALMAGAYAFFGPFGNAFGAVTSSMRAALFGGFLIFFGNFIAVFAPNMIVVNLGLGLFTGVGFAFCYGPSMMLLSKHFKVRMSLANGIAAAGGSLSTLILPFIIRSCMVQYGFNLTCLILSAISLHMIPAALLLRPITAYRKKQPVPRTDAAGVAAAWAAWAAGQSTDVNSNVARNDDDVTYELVGSRILAVPRRSSSIYKGPLTSTREEKVSYIAYSDPLTTVTPSRESQPCVPPAAPLKMNPQMFIRRLCDRSLMTDYAFLIYIISLAIGTCGFVGTVSFLPLFSVSKWKDLYNKETIIPVLGVADLVGRIGGGWFTDLGLVRKPFLVGFTFIVPGLATLFIPLFKSYPLFIIYGIILGVLGGTYQGQMVVLLTENFGHARAPSGLGILQLVTGLVLLVMAPIFGMIATRSSVIVVFPICGVLMMIAGILFYLFPKAMVYMAAKREAETLRQRLSSEEQPMV